MRLTYETPLLAVGKPRALRVAKRILSKKTGSVEVQSYDPGEISLVADIKPASGQDFQVFASPSGGLYLNAGNFNRSRMCLDGFLAPSQEAVREIKDAILKIGSRSEVERAVYPVNLANGIERNTVNVLRVLDEAVDADYGDDALEEINRRHEAMGDAMSRFVVSDGYIYQPIDHPFLAVVVDKGAVTVRLAVGPDSQYPHEIRKTACAVFGIDEREEARLLALKIADDYRLEVKIENHGLFLAKPGLFSLDARRANADLVSGRLLDNGERSAVFAGAANVALRWPLETLAALRGLAASRLDGGYDVSALEDAIEQCLSLDGDRGRDVFIGDTPSAKVMVDLWEQRHIALGLNL
jgi:hypothetical protein